MLEVAARDALLVDALRRFSELQNIRHLADYDHDALFDKVSMIASLDEAEAARHSLFTATTAAVQAFATMVVVNQESMRDRSA